MPSFVDDDGVNWEMNLDHRAIERIERRTGLDFGERAWESFGELTPITLLRVMYEACRPQAERMEVSFNQFCVAIECSAESAVETMVEALIVNRPRQIRSTLRRAWMGKS